MNNFPRPIRLASNTTRWRLQTLRAYEAALAGEQAAPAPTPDDDRLLTARQVADRYGVNAATIWRWAAASADTRAAA